MGSMMIASIKKTQHFVLSVAHLWHASWRLTWGEECLFLCKLVTILKREHVSSGNLTRVKSGKINPSTTGPCINLTAFELCFHFVMIKKTNRSNLNSP
jgi:hypothetical protein